MLEIVARHLKDVSVLRRLLFAASSLSEEVPNFWGIVVEFGTAGRIQRNSIDSDTAAAIVDNIHSFDERAFESDASLTHELIFWTSATSGMARPLGIVLISPEKCCVICGQTLTLRKDRPACITVYDYNLGPAPGSHFCTNKTCDLTQYFGYYTTASKTLFNDNWRDLEYFVSSSLTVFSMSMLKRIDIEIVIGQLSYKQIADIFNHVHACQQDFPG